VTSARERGSDRLRIAVVTETYPPEINGVANTMRQLVEGLARRGHQMTVVRPRQHGDRRSGGASAGQVLVPGLPIPGYRGLRFGLPVYRRLRRLWGASPPDAIYVATQGPLGHAAMSAARANHIAVLAGFHTQFQQYSRHYGLGLLTRSIMRLLRRFHNRADATLAPTAALGRVLHRDGFQNVHVFSRGVDTVLFSPVRRNAALRDAWGCNGSSVVALYVGRIAPEKNIGLALRAFDAITQADQDVRCVVVGDGPELGRLRASHAEYIFTGAKVGEELAEHYASADCFLFPSLTETFGNVVTEAMASGLAVVAFDYAAAHEYIVPGQNGVVVPAGDAGAFVEAAVAVASNRDRLRNMGVRARASAQTLSWERAIGGVEQRLRDVVRLHSGARGRHETLAANTQ
jgi:glycosyltransferase involved in cell wall biosynthesis